MKVCITLFVVTVISSVIAQVYVATSGSDASGCGSFNTPCRSVDFAIGTFAAESLIDIQLLPGEFTDISSTNITISSRTVRIGGTDARIVCSPVGGWAIMLSTAIISGITFQNCSNSHGGALYVTGSHLTLRECTFLQNVALRGGAIYAVDSSLLVYSSSFAGNRAVYRTYTYLPTAGGAVAALASVVNLTVAFTNCSFLGNSAQVGHYGAPISAYAGGGGAVAFLSTVDELDAQDLTVLSFTHCELRENTVLGDGSSAGGAVLMVAVPPTFGSLSVQLNISDSLLLRNGIVAGLTATGGGALAYDGVVLTVHRSVFDGNYVTGAEQSNHFKGGAVFSPVGQSARFVQTVFRNNVLNGHLMSGCGGAVSLGDAAFEEQDPTFKSGMKLQMTQCSFMNNSVSDLVLDTAFGGALSLSFSSFADVMLTQCVFVGNEINTLLDQDVATGELNGGALSIRAVHMNSMDVVADSCEFSANAIRSCGGVAIGGAVSVRSVADEPIVTFGSTVFVNCLFAANTLMGNRFALNGQLESAYGGAVSSQLVIGNFNMFVSTRFANNSILFASSAMGGALAIVAPLRSVPIQLSACEFTANVITNASLSMGGALYSEMLLNRDNSFVQGCVFANNSVFHSVVGAGGAIYSTQSTSAPALLLMDCIVDANYADSGGAIVLHDLQVVLKNCTISRNTAILGGAIMASGSNVLLNGSHFLQNFALTAGGAMFTLRADVSCDCSEFIQNSAYSGGAIFVTLMGLHPVTVTNSSFQTNAAGTGAALYAENGAMVQMIDSHVEHNTALFDGGGLVLTGLSELNSCVFESNTAGGDGGAVMAQSLTAVTNCTFHFNVGQNGGAVIANTQAVFHADHCRFLYNAARAAGGGLFCTNSAVCGVTGGLALGNNAVTGAGLAVAQASTAIVERLLLLDNIATYGGGMCAADTSTLNANDVKANGCAAVISGGALYCTTFGQVLVSNSTFVRNTAEAGGAAIWLSDFTVFTGTRLNFTVNIAMENGGAGIFYSSAQLARAQQNCTDCVFDSNIALYGRDVATAPTMLLASADVPEALSPGSVLAVSVTLYDWYHNVARWTHVPVLLSLQQASACVSGGGTQMALNGSAVFDLVITGQPGSSYSVQFRSDSRLVSNSITGVVGNCSIGQAAPETQCGTCTTCPSNTYNLNGNGTCIACNNAGFQCFARFTLAPLGYFLLYDNRTGAVNAAECAESSCLGVASNVTALASVPSLQCSTGNNDAIVQTFCQTVNHCAANRVGFLCAECAEGFADWDHKCIDCRQPAHYLIALLLLASVAYVTIFHVFLSRTQSAHTKTVIFFVQATLLILGPQNSLQLWLSFVNMRPTGGNICIYNRSFELSVIERFVLPLLYVVELLAVSLFCMAIQWRRGKPLDVQQWLIRPLFSLSLALYNPLTSAAFDVLGCRQVLDFWVITSHPSRVCSGALYLPFAVVSWCVVAAVVILWPLGLAVIALKRQFGDGQRFHRWQFVFECYTARCSWWESVALLRLTLITLLTKVVDSSMRQFLLAMLCVLAFALQMLLQPFRSRAENATADLCAAALLLLAVMRTSTLWLRDALALQWTTAVLTAVVVAVNLVVIVVALWPRLRAVLGRAKTVCCTKMRKRPVSESTALLKDDVDAVVQQKQ